MTSNPMEPSRRFGPGKRGLAVVAAVMALILLATQVAFAANPPPVQIFYVPIDEDDALTSLQEISTNPVSPVYSYISLSIGTDGTIVYYDQWENGFFNDMANVDIYSSPGNLDGTQIWGNGEADDGCPPNVNGVTPLACSDGNDVLVAGNVIVLNSTVSDLTGPTARMVIDFDGGDKIGATEQIAVSRTYWAAGANTLNAGAVEVYPTSEWGKLYEVPAGEDYSYFVPSGAAISQVGTATQASSTTSGTGLTIPKPAGVAVNDLLIAVVAWRAQDPAMGTLPTGWQLLTESSQGGSGDDITQRVYWKRAVAGDVGAANYTFSTTGNTSQRLGSITAYRNAGDPSEPPSASDSGTSTSNTAPAVNYTDGSWVMHAGSLREGSTRGGPTGSTEQIDFNTGAGGTNLTQATAVTSFVTGGTTSNNTATWGTSGKWVASHVVIPAQGTTYTFSDLNNMFEYTAVSVQATITGTTVAVDQDGAGPLAPINFTLGEGESRVVTPMYQGGTVTSSQPVQVDMMAGDPGDEYEYSAYTLIPRTAWGNSYWSPVSGQLSGGADGGTYQSQILVFNPDPSTPINVRCDFQGAGSDLTQTVPADGVAWWTVPAWSGAHCFTVTAPGGSTQDPNGPPFFVIGTVDAANLAGNSGTGSGYDWGFTPLPDGFLDTQALVGLGLGRDPNASGTQNGSPVWVTPACVAPATNTYVYVDFNGDGTPDNADLNGDNDTNDTVNGIAENTVANGVLLPTLQSIRFFDPVDFNQTGAQIYSLTGPNNTGTPGCEIAVAWGEDPGPASIGSPGFDVGTTVPPLVSLSPAKLVKDLDGDAFVTPGDTLLYTITVKNTSKFGTFDSILVSDTVPAGTTYIPNSTFKNIGGGPVAVPDNGSPTAFPLDQGGVQLGTNMAPLVTWTISFKVTIDEQASCEANIENSAFVNGVRGTKTILRMVQAITPLDCPANLIIEKVATGSDTPPGFDFTLVSSDTLPPGVLPGSVILTPPGANSSISQTISVPAGVYTVTEALESNWSLTNIVCTAGGTPVNPPLTSRQARYVLPEQGTVKCTWTNTRDSGIIRVEKNVVPDAPSTQWTMTGNTGPTAWSGTITGDGFFTRTVATGVYGIVESGPSLALYNTTWSCSAVNPAAGPITGNGVNITGLNVQKGQTWTCAYTNTRKSGTLTIQKVGIGGNDTFTYTTTGGLPNPFNITTSGYVAGVSNSGGAQQFTNLATGSYTVNESTLPPGWDFTSLSCTNGGGNTSTSGTTATIGLDEGENIVCTYTNTKRGSLEVTKVIDWNGITPDPTQKFTITVTGPSYPSGDTRTYGGGDPLSYTYTNLLPGSYTVVENAPSSAQGWIITVTPGNPQVQPGQQASVTVNNKRTQGDLVITKVVNSTYTRRFEWDIQKVVTPATVDLFDGQSGTLSYTVNVTRTGPFDEDHRITGTVTIQNVGVAPAVISSVVDQLATGTTIGLTCPGLPGTIAGGQQVVCTYDHSLNPDVAINTTNWVTVTTNINTVYTGTAPVSFGQPTVQINPSVTVSDTNGPGGVFNNTNSFVYQRPVNCESLTIPDGGSSSYVRTNTATIEETDDSSTANATINCYRLKVEKDAQTALTRTWDWDIYKVVTPTSVTLFEDESAVLTYTVGVTKLASTDSAWAASGVITVTNPAPMAANLSALTDQLLNGSTPVASPVPVCAGGTIVPASGGKITCTYNTALGSGATLTNRAVAVLAGTNYTGTATVDFANAVVTRVNDTIHVTDTYTTTVWPHSVSGSVDYERPTNCENVNWGANGLANFTLTNTAQITETGDSASVNVPVTCVKFGEIQVRKITVPSNSTQQFQFTGDLNGSIGNGGVITDTVVPGTYFVTETMPAGWVLSSINCVDSVPPPNSGSVGWTAAFDVSAGEVVTCTYTNTKGIARIFFDPPTATNEVGDAHTFTVTVQTSANDGGTWQNVGAGQVVTGTIVAGVGKPTTQTCTTNANGQCALTVNSATAGVTQLQASATVNVFGLPTLVSTSGTSGFTQDAVKTWVDAAISLTPLTAYNEVGDPHVVTATVTTQNGGTPGVAPNGTVVTFTVSGGPYGAGTVMTATVAGGAGQASITINSSSSTVITIHAATDVDVAGLTLHRETNGVGSNSGNAQKTYVDAAIEVNPPTATNEVNDPHVVTATVTVTNGGVAGVALDGTVVTFTVSGGSYGAGTEIVATVAGGQGKATVTINSSAGAVLTIHAATDVVVGGVSLHRETDGLGGNGGDAQKTYVNLNISITPGTATNLVGDAHTFTVTVQKDEGTGFVPAVGVTTTVSYSPIPSTPGSSPVTCGPTNASGQCTVSINSATPGVFAANASVTTNVGGLSLTRATGTAANTAAGGSGAAQKRYVDLRVRIDPQSETNPLNLAHTFTVSVTQNLGAGWVAVADGVTATVAIAPQPAGFTLVSDSCATPGTIGGLCTVVINSSVAQLYTANASVTTTVGGVLVTRSTSGDPANLAAGGSDGAEKLYREGALDIEKTAEPSYTRTYSWTVEKVADPTSLNLFDGQSAPVTYTVKVTKDAGTDSDWNVTGVVTITNASTSPVVIGSVDDVMGASGSVALIGCDSSAFPLTLNPSEKKVCTYDKDVLSSVDSSNTVTVHTTSGSVFTVTVPVDFGDPTLKVNDAITVSDSNTTTVWSGVPNSSTFTYTLPLDCYSQQMTGYVNGKATGQKSNVATLEFEQGADKTDSALVDVACYRLSVIKDAKTALTRTWDWDIDKSVSDDSLELYVGETTGITYTLIVTNNGSTDSNWAATGAITVSNPAPMPATLTSLTDTLSDGTSVNYTCGNVVPAAVGSTPGKLVCTYSATPPDGDLIENEAEALAYGRSYTGTAAVDFTLATVTKVNESVTITDTNVPTTTWGPITSTTVITYPYVANCEDAAYEGTIGFKTIYNQADIVETDDSDTQNVFITCTPNASITVIKLTSPLSSTQMFKFDTSWAGPFQINGASGTNTYSSGPLIPNITYSFTETVPVDWTLVNLNCVTNQQPQPFAVNPGVSWYLNPGENVVCTYTNEQKGRIIVTKQTQPDGSTQQFPFTSNWGSGSFTLIDGQSHNSGGLLPGQYSVSEGAVPGWSLNQANCTSSLGGSETPGSINLQAGETVNCTFNNIQRGRIIVNKVTQPANDPTSFDFKSSWNQGFSLTGQAGSNSHNSGLLLPGVYTVTEMSESGWSLVSVVCTEQGQQPQAAFTEANPDRSITLAPGKTVTCTYTNALRAITVKAVPLCIADAAVLSYTVTSAFVPGTPDVDLSWIDASNSSVIAQNQNLPLKGQILWPQTQTTNGQVGGQAIAWPGWTQNPDGSWTDVGSPLRAGTPPKATIIFSVNPQQTVQVEYPLTTTTCIPGPRAQLGDWVWQDVKPDAPTTPDYLAGDGLQNSPAEQGVKDITVELWSPGADGVIGGGDDVKVGTTATNAAGDYGFGNLMPGKYYLVFVNSTGSGAWSTNFEVGSNPAIDSNVMIDPIDPNKAHTNLVTLGAGDNDLTWDAAIVATVATGSSDLGNFVWNDLNKNGIQDPGEPGVPGIEVQLFQVGGGDGSSVADTLVATDTTDASGIYGFFALDPATYYIVVKVPVGYSVSPQNAGANDALDSDIDPVTGRTTNIVLPAFTSDMTWDAGIFVTPTADPIPDEPGALKLFLPTIQK